MATAHRPPARRRPAPHETGPDAPETAEETEQVEDDQDTEETAEADDQDDSGHPAEPHEYPPVEKNGVPKDVHILEADDEVKESWFSKSDENDELVVPKKTILKKVYAQNTITPSYVQLAVEGVAMTKQAAQGLGKN